MLLAQTRKQVDRELQELGFVQATQKIVKDDGIGALLVGLGPTIWGYLLEGAMVSPFCITFGLKKNHLKISPNTSLPANRNLAFMKC